MEIIFTWIVALLLASVIAWIVVSMRVGSLRSAKVDKLEARLETMLKRRVEALGAEEATLDMMRAMTHRTPEQGSRYFARYIIFKDNSQLCCELISPYESDSHQVRCGTMVPRDGEDQLELRFSEQGASIQWRARTFKLKASCFERLCDTFGLSLTPMSALVFDQRQVLLSLMTPSFEDTSKLDALIERLWDESRTMALGWASLTDEQLLVRLLELLARFEDELELESLRFMKEIILAKPELTPHRDASLYAQVEAGNPQAICAALFMFGQPIALSAQHARKLWEVVEHHPLREQIVKACPLQFVDAIAQVPHLSKLAAAFMVELARQASHERFEPLISALFRQEALYNVERLTLITKAPPEPIWARLICVYPIELAARETMPSVGALDISELWQKLLVMWRQSWPLCSDEQRAAMLTWLEQVCLRFSQGALARHGSSAAMTLEAVSMLSELGGVTTLKVLEALSQSSSSSMAQRASATIPSLQKRLKQQGAHIQGAISLSEHGGASGALSLLAEDQQGQLSAIPED